MAHFDEKSGLVLCSTEWGNWAQTVEEVQVSVTLQSVTRAKEIECQIKPNAIKLVVRGEELFSGQLYNTIVEGESTWTLNDGNQLDIILMKSVRDASNCWKSLLKDKYPAGLKVFDDMEKKLALERFHREHPGFDFSGAEITGNYHKGGPNMDNLEK